MQEEGPFACLHLAGDAYIGSQSGNVTRSRILALSLFCLIYPSVRPGWQLPRDLTICFSGSQAGQAVFPASGSLSKDKFRGFL